MPLFTRTRAPATRIEPRLLTPAEARGATTPRYGDGWGAVSLGSGYAGAGSHLAENLASVTAAVELIASSIASLPPTLLIATPDGRQPAPPTLPAWRILTRPNQWSSWQTWIGNVIGDLLLRGNSLSYVRRDGRGAPVDIVHIPWGYVSPQIIRGSGGPRLVFDIQARGVAELELQGIPARVLDGDAYHVKQRGGLIGVSALQRAAAIVSEALDVQSASSAIWKNGMRPAGVLQTDQRLDKDGRERLRESMIEFTGSSNVGKTLVLESNLRFQPVALSSADAQALETRKLTAEQIAHLFLLPVGILSGAEHAGAAPDALMAQMAQMALAPICGLLESEFNSAVLNGAAMLRIELAALLRGSFAANAAAFALLVQSGVASPNDARAALQMPRHDQGDDLRPNGAPPSFPADMKGVPAMSDKPGTGGVLPNIGTNQNGGS